jgi:hypothetical protein
MGVGRVGVPATQPLHTASRQPPHPGNGLAAGTDAYRLTSPMTQGTCSVEMDLESVSISPTVWSDRNLLSRLDMSPIAGR